MAKQGVQTTEFWLILVTSLISLVGAIQGHIEPEVSVGIMALLNGVYATLRTLAKKEGVVK